jgi:flagellar biosynthesis/type III secretory pathway chaperone
MEDVRQVDVTKGSNELYYILEKLVALHGGLCDLLREEYSHMVSVDTKGLGEAAHAKETILSEIWSHEQLRIRQCEALCVALGIDKSATLLSIADRLGADAEKFRAARRTLGLLVAQAKDLNAKNMEFAEGSLTRIEEMKRNVLGITGATNKENYSNSGSRQPITEQGGRLLSTEA